jgi:hypothetical protein
MLHTHALLVNLSIKATLGPSDIQHAMCGWGTRTVGMGYGEGVSPGTTQGMAGKGGLGLGDTGSPKSLSLPKVLHVAHNDSQWGTERYLLLEPKQGLTSHPTHTGSLLQHNGHRLLGWY